MPPPGPREERRRARHAGQKSSSPRLAKRHSAGSARHGRSHTPPSPVHATPPSTTRARGRRGAHTPTEGGQGGPPLPAPPHALRTRHRTAAAQGGHWERETMPPLGLRHLRQPGALQGHHRGPGATHSARPGGEQRGMGTALPATGRAAHPTGSQERQARASAVSEDPTPTGTLRQEPWESGVGPEPTSPTPSPPHPPATAGGRGGGARDPRAEREERSHSP